MKVDNFGKFHAEHCETAATGSLLRQEGITLSEPMMLGLGRSFGFIYWKMSFMNLPFIGGRGKPFELTRTLCECLGLELEEKETTSRKRALQNVLEPLERGKAVGLQLDCYHLEHFNHSFHFAGHFASVYGCDADHAYLFDTGKEYRVSWENLEKARFEKGSMAAKARSYTISRKKPVPPLEKIIPEAVLSIATGYLNPPIKNFGYRGIEKLAGEMPRWLEASPDPGEDLSSQAMLMEDGGTGGAIFRKFFSRFLYECDEYLPGKLFKETGKLFGEAAGNWTETARLIKLAGERLERKYLEEASDLCLKTASLEKEAMAMLAGSF